MKRNTSKEDHFSITVNNKIVVWKDRHGTLKFNGRFLSEDGMWSETYRIGKKSDLGFSRHREQHILMKRIVKQYGIQNKLEIIG